MQSAEQSVASAGPPRPGQAHRLAGGKWVIFALAGLVLLAGALRLVHLRAVSRIDFFVIPGMTPDAEYNHNFALQRAGLASDRPAAPYYVTPLYLEYLGLVYRLAGPRPSVAKLVQILLGAGNVLLMYWVARQLGGRRVGLLAAALCALYPMYIFYEATLIKTSLAVFLVLLGLGLLLSAASGENRRAVLWLLAGVVLAGVCLIRANVLVFFPLAVVAALWTQRSAGWGPVLRAAGLLALGGLLGIAPVTIRNAVAGHDFVPICWNGGFNLYLGNHPSAKAWYDPVPGIGTTIPEEARDTRRIAESKLGRTLRCSEVSGYWSGRAVSAMCEHPLATIRRAGTKLLLVFNAAEVPNTENFYFTRQWSQVLRLPLPGFGMLLPLAVLGLVVSWKRIPQATWLNLFLLSNVIGLVTVYVTARYRLPMTPAVIVYAAAGLVWLAQAVYARRQEAVARAILLVLAVFVVSFVVHPGTAVRSDFSQPLLNAARYYQSHGKPENALAALSLIDLQYGREAEVREMIGACAVDQGRYDQAREALERCIRLDPLPVSPYFHRARLNYQTGQYAAAEADLQHVVAREPNRAVAHYYLGAVRRASGQYAQAIEALETARLLKPELTGVYAELAQAYQACGKAAQAADILQAGLSRAPNDPELNTLRSNIGGEQP